MQIKPRRRRRRDKLVFLRMSNPSSLVGHVLKDTSHEISKGD